MYPFFDADHGGSLQGVINAVDHMLDLSNKDTIILPGHGPAMNKMELQNYRAMLATVLGHVKGAVKSEKTLEQILAEKPTKAFDHKMHEGIVSPGAFVTLIYDSLTQ